MSLLIDHKTNLVGNTIHFLSGASESQRLQPGGFFDVSADVAGGTLTVGVESLDFQTPSFIKAVGPRADIDYQTWYNCVAVTVTLYREGDDTEVKSIKTKKGAKKEGNQETSFTLDAGPMGPTRTRWRVRVTNTSDTIVTAIGGIAFVRDHEPMGTTMLPLRVLNHAFDVVLNAMAPHASVSGSTLTYGFGEEIAQSLDLPDGHPLRKQTYSLPNIVDVEGKLETVKAEIVSGSVVLEVVRQRWQETDARILNSGADQSLIHAVQKKNNEWKEDWEARVAADFVAVHIAAIFTDIDIDANIIPGFSLDLAAIEDVAVHIYLAFHRIAPEGAEVLILTPAHIEGIGEVAEALGILPSVQEFLTDLAPEIQILTPLVHRYFAEVLGRMAKFVGELPVVFVDASADDTNVTVRWTVDPSDQRATVPPARTGGGTTLPHRRPPVGHVDLDLAVLDDAEPIERGARGVVPAGFVLGDPESLKRLDKIETLVFIMMENRSFDHMLGYLRTVRGEMYRGFPVNASNSYQYNGTSHTATMQPITNLLRLDQVMEVPVDPHHGYTHVVAQVADGAMSGFATDLIDRGDPELALSYYTDVQLPNYYRIAGDQMVCNQWYCVHPGPTYPNRWATLSGTIPQLENFHVDDPRLGFMRQSTIFDLLSSEGIPWVYYENNLSMIRMYGRYRLDDTNVLPYDDAEVGFKKQVRDGNLPPVVFVEPRITGIPPLSQASDDHPPASLAVGQQFITDVYNTLVQSPQWSRMALVITYDEHGGFYDHVPPPGTQHGPAEWIGKVPRIHADGPEFMGVRVPTFVISPFVDPGSVSNAVFDHTSIIKTILVRHRDKLFADQFLQFGPRVSMINHLGAALNRDDARPGVPEPLPPPRLRQLPQRRSAPVPDGLPRRRPTAPPLPGEQDDFHLSLPRAMLPK